MTDDIFDMSKVRIFKVIEKKKIGDVYTLLCLGSAELSKTIGLRSLCYSKISRGENSSKNERNISCAKMLHI